MGVVLSFTSEDQQLFPICLSIFCTLPPNKRPTLTSSSGLCRAQIASSWTSSVLAAFRLPLCSVMRSQWSFAGHATLCSVSQLEDGPDSPKDAVIERRSIKRTSHVTVSRYSQTHPQMKSICLRI